MGLLVSVHAAAAQPSTLEGTVRDAETGEPVEYVQILLEEASRSTASGPEGRFVLRNVPSGLATLKAYRIGYERLTQNVELPAGDTLALTLRMVSSALEVGEVVIESGGAAAEQLADAALELEGQQLREHLGTTIAETLSEEPGVSMRSMGPAPARPVLRGLGGERLLVLEDGGRTGDLSATSSDHALVIDPMTAERLEVVRGPAALVYGSNVLGGVVNVVRDYVPSTRPDALHMQFTTQGQSASRGVAGGASLSAPAGPAMAVHADGALRHGQDIRTPEGMLDNTQLMTASASVGASLVQRWGHVGMAGSYYTTAYGIPGGFVGAHPSGVSVEMRRRHFEGRSEVLMPLPWMPRLEARGAYSHYHHQEFESNGSLGIEFGLLSYHASVIGRTAQYGPFRKGALGLWAEYRDYASGGFSFTPASTEWTVAGFGFQDVHLGAFTLQAGLRYDARQVTPRREQVSNLIGPIRERWFGGVSGAATVLWHPARRTALGVTGMRSLRMPGIEELYSEGPHLAAYSFEIGNPRLTRETGYGGEVFARYEGGSVRGSVTGFVNVIDDYIFPRNTGELNYRVYLPIYQYSGTQARMWGAEGQISGHVLPAWRLDGSMSYVRGTLTDLDQPIPWMPPLKGTVGVRFEQGALTLGTDLRWATSQERTGPFEEPTGGYATMGFLAQYYFTAGGLLHTVDLSIENMTDAAYRDHLSRVKSIMPEAGRNVKLLYKVMF